MTLPCVHTKLSRPGRLHIICITMAFIVVLNPAACHEQIITMGSTGMACGGGTVGRGGGGSPILESALISFPSCFTALISTMYVAY